MLIAPVLVIGLAACANNANDNMNNRGDNGPLHVRYNDNRLDPRNVRYDYNDRIDHNGPLTENYNDHVRRPHLGNGNGKLDRGDLNISSMNTTMDSDAYPHTRAILVQMSKYQFIPMGEGFAGVIPPQGIAPNQGFTAQIPRWQTGPTPGQQFGQAPTQQQMPTVKPPSQPQGPAAPAPAPKTPAPAPNKSTTTQGISSFAQQVIDLTNVQRKKNGLPALKADVKLSGVAQKKSVDMEQNHYFSHTSPTYGSPFDMMRDFGVSYNAAGENIAMGQRTPQEVVTAWMNSEGHRKNILSPNFTHIGVGFDKNGYYWSQMFIGK